MSDPSPPAPPAPPPPATSPRPPTRAQKRWSGTLRTGGALCVLAGIVGLVDRVLPRAHDPVLGPIPLGVALPAALLVVGVVAFVIGRRWR